MIDPRVSDHPVSSPDGLVCDDVLGQANAVLANAHSGSGDKPNAVASLFPTEVASHGALTAPSTPRLALWLQALIEVPFRCSEVEPEPLEHPPCPRAGVENQRSQHVFCAEIGVAGPTGKLTCALDGAPRRYLFSEQRLRPAELGFEFRRLGAYVFLCHAKSFQNRRADTLLEEPDELMLGAQRSATGLYFSGRQTGTQTERWSQICGRGEVGGPITESVPRSLLRDAETLTDDRPGMTGPPSKLDEVCRQLISPTMQDFCKRQRGVQLNKLVAGRIRVDSCHQFLEGKPGEVHDDKLSLSSSLRQA